MKLNHTEQLSQILEKWSSEELGDFGVGAIENSDIREATAIALENQDTVNLSRALFTEATSTTTGLNVAGPQDATNGVFSPIALTLVRRIMPNLFANEVAGMQAMSSPVGLAFALRVLYKGYEDATVDRGDGLGAQQLEAGFNGVDIFSGYTGSTRAASGTADAGTAEATATAEAWGFGKSGAEYPELTLRLVKKAIEAQTRKLAASFSIEGAYDVKQMHNLDIEKEIINALYYEILAEQDREIIKEISDIAIASSDFDVSGGNDGRWSQEKLANLINKIQSEANFISERTMRDPGNFVIVSPRVASWLQSTAANGSYTGFRAEIGAKRGGAVTQVGTINGTIKVFVDKYRKRTATSEQIIVGYKGDSVSDCGIIVSPYVTGLFNKATDSSNFDTRIGVMSRYAITSNLLGAERYYTKFNVTNFGGLGF